MYSIHLVYFILDKSEKIFVGKTTKRGFSLYLQHIFEVEIQVLIDLKDYFRMTYLMHILSIQRRLIQSKLWMGWMRL